jgi:hypothetical protein
MLELVVDPFGNAVRYGYEMDDASLAGDPTVMPPVSETAYQRYLSNIQYTSKVDSNDFEIEPPAFTVWFSRSRGRADTSLSGRAGFLVRTRDRLEWVGIYNGGSLVRWYWMNYRVGDFGKQLLETVSQFSGTAQRLQMHAFQYASAMSGGSTGFGAVRRWDVPGAGRPIPSTLGHDDSESENRSFHLGIGDPFNIVSLSGSVGGSESIGHARDTTVDLNGDGLPDFLSHTGSVALNGFHRPSVGSVDRGQGALSAVSLTSLAQTGLSERALECIRRRSCGSPQHELDRRQLQHCAA